MIEKLVEINGHSGAIYTVDGAENFIYTGSGDRFCARWDLIQGIQDKFAIQTENAIYSLALINEGKNLVLGCADGAMHVIDLLERKEVKHFIQHKKAVFSLTQNSIKKQLYSTDSDGNVAVWNTENWELMLILPLDCGKIRSIHVDKSGEYFWVCGQDGWIRKMDATRFNELTAWFSHNQGVNVVQTFPTKSAIISGGKDGFLRVWNISDEKKIIEIPAHNFGIYDLIFVNNGQHFVTVSRDKSIKIWDATTLNVVQKIERKHGGHSHAVNRIWKQDEFHFVTVGDDKRIIWWKIQKD